MPSVCQPQLRYIRTPQAASPRGAWSRWPGLPTRTISRHCHTPDVKCSCRTQRTQEGGQAPDDTSSGSGDGRYAIRRHRSGAPGRMQLRRCRTGLRIPAMRIRPFESPSPGLSPTTPTTMRGSTRSRSSCHRSARRHPRHTDPRPGRPRRATGRALAAGAVLAGRGAGRGRHWPHWRRRHDRGDR